MNNWYYPILKTLKAEFTALSNTAPSRKKLIVPLFEIPKVPSRKAYDESPTPKREFIKDTCNQIGALWKGRKAMFDFYHWDPDATTEDGEHVLSKAYKDLKSANIEAIPVVGYDRWDEQQYQISLQSIVDLHEGQVCIRLDHTAHEDSLEPDFFLDTVTEILDTLNLSPSDCHILIDFEDLTPKSVAEMLETFDTIFGLLHKFKFPTYSVAGCSLPRTINDAVSETNTTGFVIRKESLAWRSIRERYPNQSIFYGDYGVRGPSSNEGIRNPHTNGKIRYTIDKNHFVARGHSMSIGVKGEQMYSLADTIITSPYYLGPSFSWGDSEIERCSRLEFKGNAGMWIAIDTNHHVAHVLSEIAEVNFEIEKKRLMLSH